MANADDTKTVNVRRAFNPVGAVIDAAERNANAIEQFPKFFGNHEHTNKVETVRQIVESFFTINAGVYVNHRGGHNKPFSVVKVSKPDFPAMNNKKIDEQYRNPLKALGVEIVFSKGTNSYLYRIY